jgi:hypothetical protein
LLVEAQKGTDMLGKKASLNFGRGMPSGGWRCGAGVPALIIRWSCSSFPNVGAKRRGLLATSLMEKAKMSKLGCRIEKVFGAKR